MDPNNPNGVHFNTILPPGSKRTRRMRSVQGNLGSNKKKGKDSVGASASGSNPKKTSYQDSANGAAIFLVKTYDMVSTSPEHLAAWSEDGETFVVKNPEEFAKQVIPNYFDHSKFSSFSRQLNFYGFKKVPMKTVRTSEYDKESSKYVRFYNEKFKRGRKDLLSQIHRSTRNSGNTNNQTEEIKKLKDRVHDLENQMISMNNAFARMEAQMVQMMNNSYSHHSAQTSSDGAVSYNRIPSTNNNSSSTGYGGMGMNDPGSYPFDISDPYHQQQQQHPSEKGRGSGTSPVKNSTSRRKYQSQSPVKSASGTGVGGKAAGATLDPHPNVKELDPSLLPPPPDATQLRAASLLRGFSSEFTSFEAKLFESMMSDPPTATTSSTDVSLSAHEQSNIKNMEGLNISRQQTSTELLPPVDADVSNSMGV